MVMTSESDRRAAGAFAAEDFAAGGFDPASFGAVAFDADVFAAAGCATLADFAAAGAAVFFTGSFLDFFVGM
jgi:hypothetical protein